MDIRPETRLVIGPNASLDRRGAWLALGVMSTVVFGIAGLLASYGLWPVFPFAGLEMLALGLALRVSLRRNRYREVLTFSADRLAIEFGAVGNGASSCVEMPRHWTRVQLVAGARRMDPSRLVLNCSGQRVEIGRCLTDDDRRRLFDRIQQLLSSPTRLAGQAQDGERRGEPYDPVFPGDP